MNQYTLVDRQLHLLSQLIAKFNRTYMPAKDDDSHTNLFFDPIGERITGRCVRTETLGILPTFNLKDQMFQFLDLSCKVLISVETVGKKLDDIETEIEALLPNLGLNPAGFTDKLHFEITKYDFAELPVEPLGEGLASWRQYRSLANQICFSFLGYVQVHEEVRMWPHHFDTGIYFNAKNDLGLGFGLAMEDNMAGAPYFYLSAHPKTKEIAYQRLPKGNWKWEIGEHWKGAILTLDVLQSHAYPKNIEVIHDYIRSVYLWMVTQ
jgi:hypothetical protein